MSVEKYYDTINNALSSTPVLQRPIGKCAKYFYTYIEADEFKNERVHVEFVPHKILTAKSLYSKFGRDKRLNRIKKVHCLNYAPASETKTLL